jgi:phenylacetate-CoA ligase
VLFTPVSVEELVRAEFPEITEYEILVQKKGIMDEITLKIEPKEKLDDSVIKDSVTRLSERLKIKTNLRFLIEPVAPGELPRYTLKSKRFKDLR